MSNGTGIDDFRKQGAVEPRLSDRPTDPSADPASDLLRSIEEDFERIAQLMKQAIEGNGDGAADHTISTLHRVKQAAEKGAAIARRQ